MGSGKTTWAMENLIENNPEENILYITPYLNEITRIRDNSQRRIIEPMNKGYGKLDNIANLLNNQMDIASTHELFKRFDDRCMKALQEHDYTLILDETLTAVEQYQFQKPDDYLYLIENNDISVLENGLIEWTGNELNTRFDDVRILSKNHCLFKVDDKFFIWHFPIEIFKLFKKIYVLTYLFDGSIMKYYFDLYGLTYQTMSIRKASGKYELCDYYIPDVSEYKKRFNIYQDRELLNNISQKSNALSSSWFKSGYNKSDILQLKNNMYNYCRNKIKAKSEAIMWTTYKHSRKHLAQKGYTKGFVPCNCRATNDYSDKTCLIYALNVYVNPEIYKFFARNQIEINQSQVALSEMLQWVWRSNIRQNNSSVINIYIPSQRMRKLFIDWLNQNM